MIKPGHIGTFTFHLIILLILIIWGYETPLPLPAEEGIMINFGDSPSGFGMTEPSTKKEVEKQIPIEARQESNNKAEKILTDDNAEDVPYIESGTNTKKVTTKKQDPVKPKEEVKIPERTSNSNFEFKPSNQSKTETTSSQGNTTGSGNMGSKEGDPNSNDLSSGIGSGSGGTSFSLSGRQSVLLPKPAFDYQEEGKVVVQIYVDREGNVSSAEAIIKESTTISNHLINAAIAAAKKSKFDKKSDALITQRGTITYYFSLH